MTMNYENQSKTFLAPFLQQSIVLLTNSEIRRLGNLDEVTASAVSAQLKGTAGTADKRGVEWAQPA